MIGVVFSYFRSALVFVLSLSASVAGVVAVCIHTPYSYLRVLEIIGVVIIFLALCVAADLCALSIIQKEVDKTLLSQEPPETMCAKLCKLSGKARAYVGDRKAEILLMCARMRIYCGDYRDALVAASDAIVAAGDSVKDEAAVLFCEIYYMLGDGKFFDLYYERALRETGRQNSVLACKALEAMRLSLAGEKAEAEQTLASCDTSSAPPLIAAHFASLRAHVANK